MLRSKSLFLIVIVFLLLNAPLKPLEGFPLTPYYIISPLMLFGLLFIERRPRIFVTVASIFFILVYGFAVGAIYGTPLDFLVFQSVKYLQLFTVFWYLSYVFITDKSLVCFADKIIYIYVCIVFCFAAIQQITGWQIPTIVNDGSSYWLNTFFFSPNDLGLFLAAYCIYLLPGNAGKLKILFVWVFSIILNIRNDSKAALLASLVALLIYFIIWVKSKSFVLKLFSLLSIVIFFVSFYVLWLSDFLALVYDSGYDPVMLFLDPLYHIYRLETYNLGGSIYDRTDALINGIKALKENNWLGLGQGGSVYALSLPKYEVLTAKSLHNMIAEWLIDFGPIALLSLIFLYIKYLPLLLIKKPSVVQIQILLFLCAIPLLGLSQSAGYVSNYAFWLVVFLIFYFPPRSSFKS